jgi:hypothetical protein
MNITELKSKLDFYVDSIYQKGFDLGYECALEELDIISNDLWNDGLEIQAEAIRTALAAVRATANAENL